MRRVSIRRRHALGLAEARLRVARAATRLNQRFGARCSWRGDTLEIAHPGARGRVEVGADEVRIEAELVLGLGPLRARAEAEITRIVERELAS